MRKQDKKRKGWKAKKRPQAGRTAGTASCRERPSQQTADQELRGEGAVREYDESRHRCEIWQDPESDILYMDSNVYIDADRLCFDVWLRTTTGTNWFMRSLFEAYYRHIHISIEQERLLSQKASVAELDACMVRAFREVLYAFAGDRALPDLEELYFESVMHCFGCRGRAGFAISAMYRHLAEILPESQAAPFRDVDWEAKARALATKAMAEMDPALAEAYGKLWTKLAGFAVEPVYELLATSADNAACRLPAGSLPACPKGWTPA